jgi:hypothetical protein
MNFNFPKALFAFGKFCGSELPETVSSVDKKNFREVCGWQLSESLDLNNR